MSHRSHPPQYTPSQLALQNWHNQVGLLQQWEQDEIEAVYKMLTTILFAYQSSAALAITRAALEIGQLQGQ